MRVHDDDPARPLILDGNAVAGLLRHCFGTDLTMGVGQCEECENHTRLGATDAYTHAPGVVMRCRRCDATLLRIVEAGNSVYLDARGLRYLYFER